MPVGARATQQVQRLELKPQAQVREGWHGQLHLEGPVHLLLPMLLLLPLPALEWVPHLRRQLRLAECCCHGMWLWQTGCAP